MFFKESAKRFLYFYQRVFWYVSQAKNEALKPLGFWNETVLILTFLSIRFNFNPAVTDILLAYLVALAVAAMAGKLLVMLGVVQYNNKIANKQNPELMLILKKIEELQEQNPMIHLCHTTPCSKEDLETAQRLNNGFKTHYTK